MARRPNHPLKTLLLYGVLAALGWVAYEYLHNRKILEFDTSDVIPEERKEEVREAILERYRDSRCFHELGPLHYRARENRFRIDFIVAYDCVEEAQAMCEDISDLVRSLLDRKTQVWAYDRGGNSVARYVP